MNLERLHRSWLYPLIFFQIYLALTVCFLFFGPWPWNIDNPIDLLTYFIAVQVSIFIGYMAAWPVLQNKHYLKDENQDGLNLAQGVAYTRQALFITILLYMPTSLSRTGQFIPNIIAGLTDTGLVYNENYERLSGGNQYVWVEYLRMLFSPWLIALFPLTIVYWSRLSKIMRVACVSAVSANLAIYVATGTNKGLADFVVAGPWFIYLAVAVGLLGLRITRAQILIVFLVIFYGFLQFFGSGQLKREGGVGEFGIFNTGNDLIIANASTVGPYLSDNLRVIYESLIRYVVQGYYAFSMSMKIDNSSTLGFGHSMFLARNADSVFGTDYFTSQSLPGLLEEHFGWSMTGLWHSIYPWLASDFGLLGSIILMGLFAYLLSLSWGMSLCTLEYRWITLSFLMFILFFYIPANNQIFQSGETFVGFVLVLLSISLSRSRYPTDFNSCKE